MSQSRAHPGWRPWILVAAASSFFWVIQASASIQVFPDAPLKEALSETVPTGISPFTLNADEYSLEWQGEPLPGIQAEVVPGSIEWARASDLVLVPRARVMIRAVNSRVGQVTYQGFAHPMLRVEQDLEIEVPAALVDASNNLLEVRIRKADRELTGSLRIHYQPKTTTQARIYFDSSCSPFGVSAEMGAGKLPPHQWMYVGCRTVFLRSPQSSHSQVLELYILWSGAGETIGIDGIQTAGAPEPFWKLRLAPSPGYTVLKAGSQFVRLNYRLPPSAKFGSIGAGLGPYLYNVDGAGTDVGTITPILTVYGSYFISESIRLVFFDALAIHSDYYSDLGIYVNYETIRTIDRRVSLNLMLGAHALFFKAGPKNTARFGGPQGVELIFRDIYLPRHNLNLGGFILPEVERRSYYNIWIRWGNPSLFGELNYILWNEPLGGDRFTSRSLGISFGMPLFQFL